MARFRRMGSLHPVNRTKHVVDFSGSLAKAIDLVTVIAASDETPTLADTKSVAIGAKVNGFYIRVEIASNDPVDVGALPQVYMYVWKNPGGNLTTITPSVVGGSDNKRFVIHQEMAMIQNAGQGSNPRTLFNGVIVVPKGMRRMGPNDSWQVVVRSTALDIQLCIQCHYKEFR